VLLVFLKFAFHDLNIVSAHYQPRMLRVFLSPFTPVSSDSPIRPFTRLSSFCRFWLPLLLPLLVAASIAVLHDLTDCAKLFGKTIDPPQRRRERGGISRQKAFRLKVLKPNCLKPNSLSGNSLPKSFHMFPRCFHMFPYVSMAEKRIEGIGWGQLGEMPSRFPPFSPSFPDRRPSLPAHFAARVVVEWKMFVGLILRLDVAMTAINQNFQCVSRMFPWQRKRLMMTYSYN